MHHTAPPIVYWPAVLAAASAGLLLVVGATAVAFAAGRGVPTAEEVSLAAAGIPDHELQPPAAPVTELRLAAATDAPVPLPLPDVARRQPAASPLVARPDGAALPTLNQPPLMADGTTCQAAAAPRPPAPNPADRPSYGTRLAFVPVPAEAAREAAQTDKLVFLMHISGNFEDARFT
jgi:hypothetical protein